MLLPKITQSMSGQVNVNAVNRAFGVVRDELESLSQSSRPRFQRNLLRVSTSPFADFATRLWSDIATGSPTPVLCHLPVRDRMQVAGYRIVTGGGVQSANAAVGVALYVGRLGEFPVFDTTLANHPPPITWSLVDGTSGSVACPASESQYQIMLPRPVVIDPSRNIYFACLQASATDLSYTFSQVSPQDQNGYNGVYPLFRSRLATAQVDSFPSTITEYTWVITVGVPVIVACSQLGLAMAYPSREFLT